MYKLQMFLLKVLCLVTGKDYDNLISQMAKYEWETDTVYEYPNAVIRYFHYYGVAYRFLFPRESESPFWGIVTKRYHQPLPYELLNLVFKILCGKRFLEWTGIAMEMNSTNGPAIKPWWKQYRNDWVLCIQAYKAMKEVTNG